MQSGKVHVHRVPGLLSEVARLYTPPPAPPCSLHSPVLPDSPRGREGRGGQDEHDPLVSMFHDLPCEGGGREKGDGETRRRREGRRGGGTSILGTRQQLRGHVAEVVVSVSRLHPATFLTLNLWLRDSILSVTRLSCDFMLSSHDCVCIS